MPELSVLMGTCNEKDRQITAQAIDSILGQTYQDLEFIICDDGSETGFYNWLEAFCKKDARIHLLRNAQNRGLAAVLNRCFRHSSGKYIARMDADDLSLTVRLEKQAAFLRQHKAYGFVGSSAYLMDGHGIWGIRKMEEVPGKEAFLDTSPFIHPAVMFRREVLEALGGYSELRWKRRTEDYDLFMRLYAAGFWGYNLQEPLLWYREDMNSYKKRKYRYRLNECLVRCRGFWELGILKGNLRYAVKPLAAGLVPSSAVRMLRRYRYGERKSKTGDKTRMADAGSKNTGTADTGKQKQREDLEDIRIFVTHSPDSRQLRYKNPLFYHVAAGSSLRKQPLPAGMLADDTGDNISDKNSSYCELTTQYWAWKNIQADYYGFCHYRRYFSFAPQMLPEADCGFLVYPYMDPKTLKALCLSEQAVRRKVKHYDFLIAKGIPVRPWAANVYENYCKAPQLHQRDFRLFLNIAHRKYPQLDAAVQSYITGNIFYPFNMFFMKKEVFQEYSTMLFDILEEFERKADMRSYSREGRRTPGHLGERFAGIYYTYLKQKGGYRMGELQVAMFEQTRAAAGRKPRPGEIPVVLAANRAYAPVLFICLKSICICADPAREYHIYILHTDMDSGTEQLFQKELAQRHIRIDFVDVGARTAGYQLKARGAITKETYYRFLIPELFSDCAKVIYLDADTIVCEDLAKLYDIRLGDCLLAAVPDADVIGQYHGANPDTKAYQDEKLRLKDPYGYVQAGVLVISAARFGQAVSAGELFAMAQQGNYRYSDQDILNIVCQGRIRKLDMAWNVLMGGGHGRFAVIRSAPAGILDEYERAREHPYIIHYCGSPKPWEDPEVDFAQEFWKMARGTPYYEVLLYGITGQAKQGRMMEKSVDVLRRAAKKILPQGSRIRRLVGMIYWKLK